MQHWLSGYANWYAKRNQRTGHLYQGRFKAFQVEDSSYFWTLRRYIHLNPCVGKSPLVTAPQDWLHSSYANYIYRRKRIDWLESQLLLDSWRSEYGGTRPDTAIDDMLSVNWPAASRLTLLAKPTTRPAKVTKRQNELSPKQIVAFVADQCGLPPADYFGFRVNAQDREIAALLCRELTTKSLAELSDVFGLGHPDSSANLIKRAKVKLNECSRTKNRYNKLKSRVVKTENQV